MENTEILAIYGTEYKEMTKRLLEEAELDSRIPDKECRIGIKPNLVSPSEPSWGATTHPEIVAGIIEYLQERGFKELVMLEGSWVGTRQKIRPDSADTMISQKNTAWNFWICRRTTMKPMTVRGWN